MNVLRPAWGVLVPMAIAVLSGHAVAEEVGAALQTQLLAVFDSYNQAIKGGKAEDAVALRGAETRAEMKPYLGSANKRKELLAFASETIPDAVEVQHARLAKDGSSATLYTVARKKIPAKAPAGGPPGSTITVELMLKFVKEGGAWKLGDETFGMDPTKVVRCKSETYETIAAYDRSRQVSLGGLIVRVAFAADHTLVVVRVMEEETCAFLPDRATIEKAGLDPDLLVPYAIAEIDGFPHKTDKQKTWIDHIRVRDE